MNCLNLISVLASFTLISCVQPSEKKTLVNDIMSDSTVLEEYLEPVLPFKRESIKAQLEDKKRKGNPLIIHVFVPLCDNDNQGIVPVNKQLGDGLNLRTNLYWGAGYGIAHHFKTHPKWKLISSEQRESVVLERLVFKHKDSSVYLVADAYRGDKMRNCLTDYFNEIAGITKDTVFLDSGKIGLGSNTDLVVFNGHNGLMDVFDLDTISNVDRKQKDAVAIACVSQPYFKRYLMHSEGYPLVFTSNLLAPEAYVLDHVLGAWIKGEDAESIRYSAAVGYNSVQKCGIKGASRLFVTGW